MSRYSIRTDTPIESQGRNLIVGNEKTMGLAKKLGYQNHEQPAQSLPLLMPAGPLQKRIPVSWIQSATSGEWSLLPILRLGCHGTPGINVRLLLVCWVLLGFFVHFFFFLSDSRVKTRLQFSPHWTTLCLA